MKKLRQKIGIQQEKKITISQLKDLIYAMRSPIISFSTSFFLQALLPVIWLDVALFILICNDLPGR